MERESQHLTLAEEARILKNLGDQKWRLRNLYKIKSKHGQLVDYKPNWAQSQLYDDMHYLNIILKGRQLGCTTAIDLLFLDTVLFNSNKNAGIIAHHKEDALKIFEEKILLPYNNIEPAIRDKLKTITESKQELQFGHNSYIRVGTSMRSATLQYLHISEYGITCAKFPDKAQEIRTGALNTIQSGNIIFIESTSKGRVGHFPELWDEAYDMHKRMAKLSMLDWKIFFFPWWEEPEYEIYPLGISFGPKELDYFEGLASKHNIHLSERKKAWYVKKWQTLGNSIKQEYPSTPDEAWEGGGQLLNWNAIYHEIKDGPWPPPDNAPIMMGFDYGFSRPFSIGWYWLDEDGRIYRAREWYGWNGNPNEGVRLTASEIAEGIKRKEISMGIWGRVTRRIAGSDCFSRRLNPKTGELGPPISFEFDMVDPMLALEQANDKNRLACVAQVHERLRVKFDDEGNLVERPMFQVYSEACPQFMRTVPTIPPDPLNPEDCWSEGEDHCFQALTKIKTDQGIKNIIDMVGTEGLIETVGGKYRPYRNCRLIKKKADTVQLTFSDGHKVVCTPDHEFLTIQGTMQQAVSLLDQILTSTDRIDRSIVKIEPAGKHDVYCLEVPETHCFALSNNVITSNCFDEVKMLLSSWPIGAKPKDNSNKSLFEIVVEQVEQKQTSSTDMLPWEMVQDEVSGNFFEEELW